MKLVNKGLEKIINDKNLIELKKYGIEQIIRHYALTENQIEKLITYFDNSSNNYNSRVFWMSISAKQKLSEKFIEKYIGNLYFDALFCNQKLSEEFITKYSIKFKDENWKAISRTINKKFSQDFYYKFYDKLDLDFIYNHQKIILQEFYEKLKIMKELSK